jgi:hypothetical protein
LTGDFCRLQSAVQLEGGRVYALLIHRRLLPPSALVSFPSSVSSCFCELVSYITLVDLTPLRRRLFAWGFGKAILDAHSLLGCQFGSPLDVDSVACTRN